MDGPVSKVYLAVGSEISRKFTSCRFRRRFQYPDCRISIHATRLVNIIRHFLVLILPMWFSAACFAQQSREADSVRVWIDRIQNERRQSSANVDSLASVAGLPSAKSASAISIGVTAVSIGAGALVMALKKSKHIREYDSNGNLTLDYYKDPNLALPLSMIAFGVMCGPAVGHIWGGCSGSGMRGIAVRTGTAAMAIGAAIVVAESTPNSHHAWDLDGGSTALVTLGAVAVLIESVYDLVNVDNAVRRYNAKKLGMSLSLAPTYESYDELGLRLTVNF